MIDPLDTLCRPRVLALRSYWPRRFCRSHGSGPRPEGGPDPGRLDLGPDQGPPLLQRARDVLYAASDHGPTACDRRPAAADQVPVSSAVAAAASIGGGCGVGGSAGGLCAENVGCEMMDMDG
jgi:hypothetical protein